MHGDSKIFEYLEKGLSIDKIEKELGANQLYTQEEIMNNVNDSIAELQAREERCDVTISDYILEHYQKEYLFYSPSHPTTAVLVELMRRVYSVLNITNYKINVERLPENNKYEVWIYPCVRRQLKLSFSKQLFHLNGHIHAKDQSLREYIEMYRELCFPELGQEGAVQYRTIPINHLMEINENSIKERIPKTILINYRCVHINLYLDVVNNDVHGNIAKIEAQYAPKEKMLCLGQFLDGSGNIPITICPNGNMTADIIGKQGRVMLIDFMYYI